MKKIDRFIWLVITGFLVLIGLVNGMLIWGGASDGDRFYRVSVNRIKEAVRAYELKEGGAPDSLDVLLQKEKEEEVKSYPGITGLYPITVDAPKEELAQFLQDESEDYVILATKQYYYRITYKADNTVNKKIFFIVNGVAIVMFLAMLFFLLYMRQNLLLPFHQFASIPYELSKGNLTIPLKEHKNRYFGKYIWGMNLLRENLEEHKVKELELQKEKKLLLLSLSHDIKTPLSAIKLYAKALMRGLYKDEERKQEIAVHINEKVDEIEAYISEIVRASHEDFLHFDVNNKEFYAKEVLEQVREYYMEKMALNQIDFEIAPYDNCLLVGDADRLLEVLQNIIENGIKYGDGGQISIRANREEEGYEISVSSTGCELLTKELPHLFDSFFRGSNVGKKPGSGLGLYICRQLVHLMEGEVRAFIREEKGERIMVVNVVLRLA